jgi:branched-chain amino acid transport system ATP-binding protein
LIDNCILKINDLNKTFGGLAAVRNVCLNVNKGEIYGLIGPNGAGKTTIFNLITGIIEPTKGSINFDGEELTGLKPHKIAQKGIGRTFQNIKLFGNLTVFNNILTVAQVGSHYSLIDGFLRNKKCRHWENELNQTTNDIIDRIGISKYSKILTSNLSYGVQRRVEIARALALKPKLLLLDEPAAGMNEDESYELSNLVKKIRDEFDVSIIVIDHHMDFIMDICNKITVLNFGKIIATGTTEEIQKNPAVVEAYLGVEEDD